MTDQLIRGTFADGGIRIVGAVTTGLTEEARQRHQLSYVSTAALGRAMAAALLLASNMKNPKARVNLSIKGNGPLKGLFVDAGHDGTVRGYVYRPNVEIDLSETGALQVGHAIGSEGVVQVIRDEGQGEPFSSTVELINGEIDADVAEYLAQSEQTPSGLSLETFIKSDGVKVAGGLLIQVLPKAAENPHLVTILESRLAEVASFTSLLQEYSSLENIFETLFGDFGLEIFPQTQPLSFHCKCSRDRVLSALKLLGVSELQEMLDEDGGAETTCDFCNTVYHIDRTELLSLIQELEIASA